MGSRGTVLVRVVDAGGRVPAYDECAILWRRGEQNGIDSSVRRLGQVSCGCPLLISGISPQQIVGILLKVEVVVALALLKKFGTWEGVAHDFVASPDVWSGLRDAQELQVSVPC